MSPSPSFGVKELVPFIPWEFAGALRTYPEVPPTPLSNHSSPLEATITPPDTCLNVGAFRRPGTILLPFRVRVNAPLFIPSVPSGRHAFPVDERPFT